VTGATASLPDMSSVLDAASNAQTGLATFMQVAGSLGSGGASSPLHAVQQVFGGVQGASANRFGAACRKTCRRRSRRSRRAAGRHAGIIENLQHSYQELSDFYRQTRWSSKIAERHNLEQTALAVVESVLGQFGGRLTELGSSLLDADTLAESNERLTTLEQLAPVSRRQPADLMNLLAGQLAASNTMCRREFAF